MRQSIGTFFQTETPPGANAAGCCRPHLVTPVDRPVAALPIVAPRCITETAAGSKNPRTSAGLVRVPVIGAEPWARAHFSLAPARLGQILYGCAAATVPFRAEPSRA